jgi:hypothetical protein
VGVEHIVEGGRLWLYPGVGRADVYRPSAVDVDPDGEAADLTDIPVISFTAPEGAVMQLQAPATDPLRATVARCSQALSAARTEAIVDAACGICADGAVPSRSGRGSALSPRRPPPFPATKKHHSIEQMNLTGKGVDPKARPQHRAGVSEVAESPRSEREAVAGAQEGSIHGR